MDRLFLDFSTNKLRQLSERIEDCVNRLDDKHIWMRGGGEAQNSIGNLILHLCGNLRQWILASVGGQPLERDRDAEFAATYASKNDLLQQLRTTVDAAIQTISGLKRERLEERVRVQNYDVTVLEAVYHVVEHFAQHTGQIIFATKLAIRKDLGYYRHLNKPAHQENTP